MQNEPDILDLIEDNDLDGVKEFIAADADMVYYAPYGETPLHVAAEQGHIEIVRYLLEHGALVNRLGNNGHTPLHRAAVRGKVEVAKVLIAHGADLEAINDYGFTPLLTAAKLYEPEVADLLIKSGANFPIESAVALGRIERVKELLSQNDHLVEECPFRNSLLDDAVQTGSPELVRALIDLPGIDVNAIGGSGQSPIVTAVSRSDFSPQIVKMLLDHGADPYQRMPTDGQTAIDTARRRGNPDLDRMLKGE